MVGCDAAGTRSGFSQAAGRAGATLSAGAFDLSFYHRSHHNFDHQSTGPQKFLNDNHISLKYNFGSAPR
jgi:hypothetical protein